MTLTVAAIIYARAGVGTYLLHNLLVPCPKLEGFSAQMMHGLDLASIGLCSPPLVSGAGGNPLVTSFRVGLIRPMHLDKSLKTLVTLGWEI